MASSGRAFLFVAGGVTAVDLAAKAAATSLLAHRTVDLPGAWRLVLVQLQATAPGLPGAGTDRLIHLAANLLLLSLIAAVLRQLAATDSSAPTSLGLIAGAAVGNLVSTLDFIGLGTSRGEVVWNLADMALLAGLTLLGATAYRLFRQIVTVRTVPRIIGLPRGGSTP